MNNHNHLLLLAVFLMAAAPLRAQQFFFSAERPSSCAASDGIITIVPTRGVPPFTYLWSNGSTEVSAKNLSKGTYSATLTDAGGATVTHTHILNTEEFDLLLSGSLPDGPCTNSGALTVDPVGGIAPFTYAWSNGQTGTTASGLAVGTYSLTVVDGTGCSALGEFSVSPPQQPYYPQAETAVVNQPDCANLSNGELSAHMVYSSYAPFTYAWSNGATGQTITALTTGTYIVTITDALGCTASTTAVLGKKLNMTGSVVCNGNPTGTASAMLVNATLPVNYVWNNGQTGPSLSNLSGGFYIVTATDANGCTATKGVQVNIPQVSVYSNTPKCYTGNKGTAGCWVNFDQATSYLWDNGVTDSWNNTLSPGLHSVSVTTALGCTVVGSVVIPAPVAAPFTFAYTSTPADCANGGAGALNVSVSGGISPYTFYAYGPDGFFTNDINSLQNIQAGSYSLTAYTIGSSCYGQETVTVADLGGFEPTLSVQQPDCTTGYGSAEILGVSTANAQYQWSNGASTASVFNLTEGTYRVTVSAGGACTRYFDFSLFIEKDSLGPQSNCSALATGMLINDLGATGCNGTAGIPYQLIRAQPSGALNFTDENGVYRAFLPNGTFDIAPANYDPADIACPTGGKYTVNAVQGTTSSGLDFHFYNPNPVDHRLRQQPLRTAQPGYPYSVRFEVCNDGSTATPGTVDLEYGNFLSGVASVSFAQHPGALVFVNETLGSPNNTARFSFPGIAPGACELFQVDFVTPTGTPVNTAFISTAKVSPPNGDPTPDNNVAALYSTVVGSFDPNCVLAYPARNGNPKDGGNIQRNTDKTIQYQIFFQNTGNAPADLVVVHDALDAHLDPATIRNISASHPMKLRMEDDNQKLVFTFANIDLPDSTTNYAGSIGYVQYQVDVKPGLSVGDLVEKQAAIFFDFNSPVITNNNVLTVVNTNGTTQSGSADDLLIVSPNPADAQFRFLSAAPAELSIFNAVGDLISTQNLGIGLQEVNTSALPSGIYLVRLNAEGRVKTGKVVVSH
jgi:uncharacterized repeat protein (TIGR01451 family)